MTFLEENNIVLSRTQRMKDFVKSWALPVICFVVFWLIFKFILMTAIIPTQSMYPTLSAPCFTVGVRTDVLNKSYERGDIVLFQRDDGNERFIEDILCLINWVAKNHKQNELKTRIGLSKRSRRALLSTRASLAGGSLSSLFGLRSHTIYPLEPNERRNLNLRLVRLLNS